MLRFLLATLIIGFVISCGDPDDAGENLLAIDFIAGDLDPFGCPYVDPVPWVARDEHEESCGAGCEPGWEGGSFMVCLSEESRDLFPELVLPTVACMRHPVSRAEYLFDVSDVTALEAMCWRNCGESESLRPPTGPEDRCYEAPAGS